jgi:hypothetical protein
MFLLFVFSEKLLTLWGNLYEKRKQNQNEIAYEKIFIISDFTAVYGDECEGRGRDGIRRLVLCQLDAIFHLYGRCHHSRRHIHAR